MRAERERQVSEAFVEIASSLARGDDVVDMLDTLTADCARLLDVAAAGLLLADGLGVLHVLAASSKASRQLEVVQLQREDGPCLDCFHSGEPVSAPDLDAAAHRWPRFVPAAQAAGFASVHALPMHLQASTLGALGLFGSSTGALNAEDLRLGQALADVASVALVQDRAAADRLRVTEQLQRALTSRVVVEQAKGVLAQVGGVAVAEAFTVLRHYARDRGRKLTDVAEAVIDRTLSAREVFDHSRARGTARVDEPRQHREG